MFLWVGEVMLYTTVQKKKKRKERKKRRKKTPLKNIFLLKSIQNALLVSSLHFSLHFPLLLFTDFLLLTGLGKPRLYEVFPRNPSGSSWGLENRQITLISLLNYDSDYFRVETRKRAGLGEKKYGLDFHKWKFHGETDGCTHRTVLN